MTTVQMPFQTRSIDRANRAISMHAAASSGGVGLAQFPFGSIACTLCQQLVPAPLNGVICPIVCNLGK